jgi:hypothetical protein
LNIPQSSHTSVKNALLLILAEKSEYCINIRRGGGRPPLIVDGTAQADVVYRALGASLSAKDTVCLLNFYRERMDPPLDPISRSAMQGFIERSPAIKTRKRGKKKSGRDDASCLWAKSRVQLCKQFLNQLELGAGLDDENIAASTLPPLFLDGIAWYDEHHREVILGNAGPFEYLIARDPITGLVTSISDGGVFPAQKSQTTVKYLGEARGCFGVAVVTHAMSGEKVGHRSRPFNYTCRKVITEKAFRVAMKVEKARVLNMKGIWKSGGYEGRYGDNWEKELRAAVNDKLCSILDIIDYMIVSSTAIYAGSTLWTTFADLISEHQRKLGTLWRGAGQSRPLLSALLRTLKIFRMS